MLGGFEIGSTLEIFFVAKMPDKFGKEAIQKFLPL
jgi:hypothetical protein